ncbi:MAG TPA: alpha/beta hydrolase [bacterium]|nr:alpha/beta hydrolase [bacterium]
MRTLLTLPLLLTAFALGCPRTPKPAPPSSQPAQPAPAVKAEPAPAEPVGDGPFAYDPSVPLTVRKRLVTPDKAEPGAPLDGRYELTQVEFQFASGPARGWLTVPRAGTPPYPAVLLLHGHGSNATAITAALAPRCATKGLATLSVDLSLAPARGVAPGEPAPPSILIGTVVSLRQVQDFIAATEELNDGQRGAFGYGTGAYLGGLLTGHDVRIDALVMAAPAGFGYPPTAIPAEPPEMAAARTGFAFDPSMDLSDASPSVLGGTLGDSSGQEPLAVALRREPVRPVMVLGGRQDWTNAATLPRFVQDLGPETVRWYDAGHRLPGEALDDAVGWLAEKLAGPAPAGR